MSSMGVVREFTTFLAVWLVVTSAPASTATNTTSTPPSTVLDNLTPSAEAVSTTEGEVVTPFFVSDTTKGSNDSVIIENTSIDTTKTNDDIIENTSTDTTKTNNDIIEDIIEDISTDTTKTNNDIIENTSTDTTKTNNDIIENTLTDTTKTNNDIIENTSTDTTKTNDDIIENTSTDTTKTNTDIIENTSTNTTPPTSTTSHDLYDEPTDTTPSSTVPDADYDLLYEAQRVYKQLHGIIHNSDSFKYRIPPFRTSIEMYFEPVQVVSVNDGEQSVHLKVFIDLYWTDMSLAWDPLDYQGLDMLEISSDKIWTPRIIIPHAIEKEEIQVPKFLHLSHDGGVRALVPGFVKFLCYLDLEFFPFDEHKCQLAFLESSRNTLLPLTTTSATTLKAEFSTSADWVLLGYNCTQNTLPREDTTFVSCDMRMRRRSTFYVVNLVLPMALTSTMTLAVFLVPVESGEKLSFLVSIFVSTSVFLNFIVDLVPRSMEKTPRINAALIALLCKIILVTGATIYVLHRYNKQQQQQQQQQEQEEQQQQQQQHNQVSGDFSRPDSRLGPDHESRILKLMNLAGNGGGRPGSNVIHPQDIHGHLVYGDKSDFNNSWIQNDPLEENRSVEMAGLYPASRRNSTTGGAAGRRNGQEFTKGSSSSPSKDVSSSSSDCLAWLRGVGAAFRKLLSANSAPLTAHELDKIFLVIFSPVCFVIYALILFVDRRY